MEHIVPPACCCYLCLLDHRAQTPENETPSRTSGYSHTVFMCERLGTKSFFFPEQLGAPHTADEDSALPKKPPDVRTRSESQRDDTFFSAGAEKSECLGESRTSTPRQTSHPAGFLLAADQIECCKKCALPRPRPPHAELCCTSLIPEPSGGCVEHK